MNHCGLLIYDAARIYYEEESAGNQPSEMVSLITHLDCHILRDPRLWEHYFLFRTNRSLITSSHSDSIQEAMSPIKKLGNKSFVYSDNYKAILRFIQENKDQVTVTLKEIVYYLTLVEGLAPKARQILVRIFTKYKIDQTLVQQTLFLERRYNEAYLDSKIQTLQRPRTSSVQSREDQLLQVFIVTVRFLSIREAIEIINLSKDLQKRLKEPCLRHLLGRESLNMCERRWIYRLAIPRRYKAEDYILDKTIIPINPACARTIKLDLDRTCRLRPEAYQVPDETN